jgi:hypothetical protein
MYIVISQLVYGPAIETAAVTIKKLVNTSTCRADANDEVDYEEVASHCNMSSEVGDHTSSATTSLAIPSERLSI